MQLAISNIAWSCEYDGQMYKRNLVPMKNCWKSIIFYRKMGFTNPALMKII